MLICLFVLGRKMRLNHSPWPWMIFFFFLRQYTYFWRIKFVTPWSITARNVPWRSWFKWLCFFTPAHVFLEKKIYHAVINHGTERHGTSYVSITWRDSRVAWCDHLRDVIAFKRKLHVTSRHITSRDHVTVWNIEYLTFYS